MIQLKVNGTSRQFDGDPDMPLLWYLRDVIELTGTKFGCGIGAMRRVHGSSWTARPREAARRTMKDAPARTSPPSKA